MVTEKLVCPYHPLKIEWGYNKKNKFVCPYYPLKIEWEYNKKNKFVCPYYPLKIEWGYNKKNKFVGDLNNVPLCEYLCIYDNDIYAYCWDRDAIIEHIESEKRIRKREKLEHG
jgi:hypothetical protein